jgi:MobA/MobL family
MAEVNGLYWLDLSSMSRQVFPAGTKDAPGRMRQHGNYILRDSACDKIITVGGEVPAQKHAVKRFLEAYELVNKADRTKAEEERLWKGERQRNAKGQFTGYRHTPLYVYLPEAYRKPMRENGRWNYKIMHALPKQFSREAQIKATRRFCQSVTMGGRGIAIAAMHDLDTHNPHVHIMFFDRDTETGKSVQLLSEKASVREKKGLEPNATVYIRKMWEIDCNGTAAEHGYEVRIDHRSNAARGLEAGDQKRGWAVNALEEERDQETLKLARATRSEIVVDLPDTSPQPAEEEEELEYFLDWPDAAEVPGADPADEELPQSAPTPELEPEPPPMQESPEIAELEPDMADDEDKPTPAGAGGIAAVEDARADAEPEGEGWISGGPLPRTVAERVTVAAGQNERLERIKGAEQSVRMATFDITEANNVTQHKSYDLQQAQAVEGHAEAEARQAAERLQRLRPDHTPTPGTRFPNSRLIPERWRGKATADRELYEQAVKDGEEKSRAYTNAKGRTQSAINELRSHQAYIESLELKRARQMVETERVYGRTEQREAEKQMLKGSRDAIMKGSFGPHNLGPSITAEMVYEAFQHGEVSGKAALDALSWMGDTYFVNIVRREVDKALSRGKGIAGELGMEG